VQPWALLQLELLHLVDEPECKCDSLRALLKLLEAADHLDAAAGTLGCSLLQPVLQLLQEQVHAPEAALSGATGSSSGTSSSNSVAIGSIGGTSSPGIASSSNSSDERSLLYLLSVVLVNLLHKGKHGC
jgi:hypothetical protein